MNEKAYPLLHNPHIFLQLNIAFMMFLFQLAHSSLWLPIQVHDFMLWQFSLKNGSFFFLIVGPIGKRNHRNVGHSLIGLFIHDLLIKRRDHFWRMWLYLFLWRWLLWLWWTGTASFWLYLQMSREFFGCLTNPRLAHC